MTELYGLIIALIFILGGGYLTIGYLEGGFNGKKFTKSDLIKFRTWSFYRNIRCDEEEVNNWVRLGKPER